MKKHFHLPVQQVIERKKSQGEVLLAWMKSRQEVLAIGALLALLLAFGVPYYRKSQRQAEKDASGMLSMAEYSMNSPVNEKEGPFKTKTEKYQQSLDSFQRVLNNYGGTAAAKTAQYYIGKCHYLLGNHAQACASFEVVMSDMKGTPMAEAAELGRIYATAAQGKNEETRILYERFLKDRPGSYLAPEARLAYADFLIMSGSREQALDELRKLSEDNKETYWGKEAARRLKVTAGS